MTLLVLALLAAAPVETDARLALVIGSDHGLVDEQPLEYAEADAERFHRLLLQLGEVRAERAYLLTRGGAPAVRKAFAELKGRLAELQQRMRTSLVVYVSAHADENTIHLDGTELPISELKSLLAEVPAHFRLAVIDACRTKVPHREKGGRQVAEVAVAVPRNSKVDGLVLLTSAGDGQPAQEWTYLRGSLFSHHLMAAMRGLGDANEDGAITLNEAYAYAYRHTVSQSVLGQAGVQQPSFQVDVSGFGEWILARPQKLGATLVLAKTLEGTYWVADGKQEMIAEVSKPAGATMSVSLQPGWYRIVRPNKRTASVAEVNLAWGGTRELSVDDFAEVRLDPTRLRGAEPIVVRPWRVSLGYGLGSPLLSGETLEHGVEASFSRRSSWWFLRGSLSANFSALSGSTFRASQRQFGAGLGFGLSTELWLFDVSVAVELRGAYLSQIVVRGDADDVGRIFGVVEPERGGWIFGGGLRMAATMPLGDRWAIGLSLAGVLMRVPMESGSKVVPSGQLGASVIFSL